MPLFSKVLVSLLGCWMFSSSLWLYPHSLSYFNDSIGGPLNGPKHLLGSNMDWGQDLRYLKLALESRGVVEPVYLAYYGYLNPADIGIDFSPPRINSYEQNGRTTEVLSGWHVVSVNLQLGRPGGAYDKRGRSVYYEPHALEFYKAFCPVAYAGYSIAIYSIRYH